MSQPLASRSTYRQGDFSTFGNLFRQYPQEVEYSGMALVAATELPYHGAEYVVPVLHLDGQYRQTNAELYSNRLRACSVALEQDEDLGSESFELVRRNLSREVISDLWG